MVLVRFYAMIIQIAIALALIGQLKSCTLMMMDNAAQETKDGIMSYSKFTRMLTDR